MTLMKSGQYYEYDEPQMDRKTIELLWSEFGNCNRDDDDCIDSSWCGWERGTNVHEIWHWFDAQYAQWGGVHAMMFPSERKEEPIWSEYLEAVDTVCGMCCYDTERALEGDDSQCAACMVRKTCDIAYEEIGHN